MISEEIRKEIIGIVMLGLFLFLLASLLSYYPFDPSLNTVASGGVRNFCGRAGSYTSDFLIQIFGVMSYLLVVFVLVFSVIYLMIWFRGTFPRYRYDQLMNIGWKIAIPVGMAAVLINAVLGMLRKG